MALSDSLVNDFAKMVAGTGEARDRNRSAFMYGTAQVDGDDVSVIFDGAEEPTPVSTTVGVKTGDRVLVLVRNHSAVVMSNITSPVATFEAITAKYADLGGFISVANDTGCDSKTSDNGGHRYKTSLYKHSTDGTYEYETGMKGDSTGQDPSQNLAFYVRQIPYGATWAEANITSNFYVRNNGYLYAKNAKIKGEVEATKFKATWAGSTVTDILATAELTGQGLVVGSKYSGYGNYYVHLYPEETYWSKSKDAPEASQNVAINYGGITFNKPSAGEPVIEMRVSDGRIAASGEIYTSSNIKSRNESTGAYTNIHANSVDVFAEGNEGERTGRFTASAAGNVGLYDVGDSSWIIQSNASKNVNIPHPFRSYNAFDTTLRCPVGSSAVANQGISWLGGTAASTLSVRGNWNSSSPATKTIAVSSSDIRLKKDISDTKVDALDVISRIPMHEFTWKEDDVKQKLGMIADELEKIDPLFVVGGGEDENGNPIYKSINVLYLLGYCVKAIQELKGDRDDGR